VAALVSGGNTLSTASASSSSTTWRLTLAALRSPAILLVGVALTVGFSRFLDRFYPLRFWLFSELLSIWCWDLLLTVACASFGHMVLVRILRTRDLTGFALLAISLPVGLVSFGLGMYLGGFLALYGPVFAVALPVVLLLVGVPDGLRALKGRPRWPTGMSLLATIYGSLCLALLYLELVSPDALNYDSTWTHLVIPQDYAREGRIFPFIADWNKNVPHFASIIQTWGFIIPGQAINHPTRWMMALHTEFTVFLWTLAGVAAAVEWLAGEEVRGAWAAFFLFPSIFVYDGNMGGSSDHFLALFAAPMLLATARAARRFDVADCALLGILSAGAIMTKLHAVYMIAPIAVVLAGRWVQLGFHRLQKRPGAPQWPHLLRGVGAVIGCTVVLGSPHFLKNWFYFRNPVYPVMQATFKASTPTVPGAARMVDYLFVDWRHHPPTLLSQRLWEALQLMFTFSFEPHYTFIGNWPMFGSLFTLLLPVALLLPSARRLWLGYFLGLGALFTWGFTFRVDRNLQTFLPILVAVTAATIVRAWKLGLGARLGILPIVALQIVWGADFFFTGSDRLQAGVALIRSGFEGRSAQRFADYRRGYRELGQAIPTNALAVLHNSHISLGINRRILLDWVGFQGLIDYRTFRTPRDAYDRFAALGVTHFIVSPGPHPAALKQEEVIFDAFTSLYATKVTSVSWFALYEMPGTPPPAEQPFRVLMVGIPKYADGVYPVEHLGTIEEMPEDLQHFSPPDVPLQSLADVPSLLPSVNAVMLGSSTHLDPAGTTALGASLRAVASYGSFTVYARTPDHPRGP
jgi:hypothetical protein